MTLLRHIRKLQLQRQTKNIENIMKSTFIFAAFLALCVVNISARYTDCGADGCMSVDENGNGFRCGPDGCGQLGGTRIERAYQDGENNKIKKRIKIKLNNFFRRIHDDR